MVWLAGVFAAGSVAFLVISAIAGVPSDFSIYLGAAATVGHGGAGLYTTLYDGWYFTYPPFGVLVMQPLRLLTREGATVVWSLASLCALVAILWICVKDMWADRARDERLVAFLVALGLLAWLEPVVATFFLGQIDLLVALLVVVDLSGRWQRIPRGVLIGVAAGLKLTPLLLVVFLLATRRFRMALGTLAGFAVTVVLGALFVPRASWQYWSGDAFDSSRVARYPGLILNQSLRGVIVRASSDGAAASAVWLVLALLLTVCGIWLICRSDAAVGLLVSGASVMLLACVISPIGWDHHFVWVIVPLLYLVSPRTQHWRGRYVVGAVMLLSFTLDQFLAWIAPLRQAVHNDYSVVLQIWGALPALVVVGLLAYIEWQVRQARRSPVAATTVDLAV
jgi:alpha-1,2-mannosyltransferase